MWAACAAAGLPVHTHSGEAPRDEYNDHIGIYLAEVVWWTHRPIAHLLFSGAFERHPGLKFVVTEAAALLGARHEVEVGPVLRRRSHHQEDGRADAGQSSRSCRRSTSAPTSSSAPRRCRRRRSAGATSIGTDCVMWGTDYPHPEGTWPNTVARLQSDFADVPVEDARRCSASTAARCYGFDLDALAPIAERIGPTPDDLGQDVSLRRPPTRSCVPPLVEGRVRAALGHDRRALADEPRPLRGRRRPRRSSRPPRSMVVADGVAALSMRKLAAELGLTPTAIYWHVGDRDELLHAVFEAMLGELPAVRGAGRTPRARVASVRARGAHAAPRAPAADRARARARPFGRRGVPRTGRTGAAR